MSVSVITPSFNGSSFLPCCCASVADQKEALAEHIIVDGGSTDGTVEWLRLQKGLRWISEKDRGMYDAVNKGFKMAQGEILAYLNCDEQYLSGTLAAVAGAFRDNPQADIVFGDALLVRPDGTLIAFRKAYPLRWPYIVAGHLYVLSCATFFRRRIVEDGFLYDTSFRYVGDAELMIRILRGGYRALHLRRYLSAFTMTGANMSTRRDAVVEMGILRQNAPSYVRALRPLFNGARIAEKVLHGAYVQHSPLDYSIYTDDSPDRRIPFHSDAASFRWKDQ